MPRKKIPSGAYKPEKTSKKPVKKKRTPDEFAPLRLAQRTVACERSVTRRKKNLGLPEGK